MRAALGSFKSTGDAERAAFAGVANGVRDVHGDVGGGRRAVRPVHQTASARTPGRSDSETDTNTEGACERLCGE